MERRKKRVKWAISVEKLSIGKTENSLESVLITAIHCKELDYTVCSDALMKYYSGSDF